jgi:hypothetical protein
MFEVPGTWVASYSGLTHFHPPPEPGQTESYDDFMARVGNLPAMIGGHFYQTDFRGTGLTNDEDSFTLYKASGTGRSEEYALSAGYHPIAGILCLKFVLLEQSTDRVYGSLTGYDRINRGGTGPLEHQIIRGEWVVHPDPGFNTPYGTFHTVHESGPSEIQNNYQFVARSDMELEWVVHSSHRLPDGPEVTYRPRLVSGTLRKVVFEAGPIVTPG